MSFQFLSKVILKEEYIGEECMNCMGSNKDNEIVGDFTEYINLIIFTLVKWDITSVKVSLGYQLCGELCDNEDITTGDIENITVKTNKLLECIKKFESMGDIDDEDGEYYDKVGNFDVHIVVNDNIEILLCHESDIHFRYNNFDSKVEYMFNLFKDIGIMNIYTDTLDKIEKNKISREEGKKNENEFTKLHIMEETEKINRINMINEPKYIRYGGLGSWNEINRKNNQSKIIKN